MEGLKDEYICECGGYVPPSFTRETDQDDDIMVVTVSGYCSDCGKAHRFKEYYKYIGCK